MVLGLLIISITIVYWWRDILRERTFQGFHTLNVSAGMRWGMILFIISEVCFFFAFFWAYFHRRLVPRGELGSVWPPVGIIALNPFHVPLLNTAVLLGSGVTVTAAHHGLMAGLFKESWIRLLITVVLGVYFTVLQGFEYYEASFGIYDGVYGTTFFVATGFHGLHVLIGTIFLGICLVRHLYGQFSDSHHFGFEAAA